MTNGTSGSALPGLNLVAMPGQRLATLELSGFCSDVQVVDGLAYVAGYYDGLHVVDVRDPTNPIPVDHFQQGTQGFEPYAINIGGPAEVWEKMMVRRPRPFYHDWFAASFHHEFTLGGDLESAYAYYYAIRRINAIMREAVTESRAE